MLLEAPWKILGRVFFILLFVSTIVFASTYLLPYAHNDETYLIRTWQHYKYFDVEQGRPLLWYVFNVCAQLYNKIGLAAFRVIRFAAVCLLPVFGLLLYVWINRWERNRYTVLCFVIAAMTLPSCQIIIGGGGSWLIFPLILASAAPNLFFVSTKKPRNQFTFCLLAMILILLSLAFYQAFVLLIFAMLMVPIIYADYADKLLNKDEFKCISRVIICTIITIGIYFIIWFTLAKLFVQHSNNSGYLPWSVFGTVFSNIKLFYQQQLPHASLLWAINGNPRYGLNLLFFAIIAGFILETLRYRHQKKSNKFIKIPFQRLVALLTLLIGTDVFFFFANNGVFYRYTTSVGLALAIMFFYWKLFLEIMRLALQGRHDKQIAKIGKTILTTIVLSVSISAAIYTTFYLSFPIAKEFNYTVGILQEAKKQYKDIGKIEAILRSPCRIKPAPLEFSWQYNSCINTYAWYLIRLALLQAGMDERRNIVITSTDGVITHDLTEYGLPVNSINSTGKTVILDFRPSKSNSSE